MGIELEFFLVKEQRRAASSCSTTSTPLEQPCYDMKGLTRNYEFIAQLSRYVNELGWGNYANDHEDANGQFESNFDYADALTTADRAIFFRYMVHAMAQERGHLATFMPKPFSHLTGNGAHLHVSLWDPSGETNLFEDDDDPRGLGLSSSATSSWPASSSTWRRASPSWRRRSTRTSASASAPRRRAPRGRRRTPRTA